MKMPLDLSFKGERHYIQGGDFFNSIQAAASSMHAHDKVYVGKLSFKRFAYHLCELCFDEGVESEGGIGSGELVFGDGRRLSFWISEGGQKPQDRRPYDEEKMVAAATYTAQSASLKAPIEYSAIEAVIALTKVLNYRLAAPKEGKWVFGQIELTEALPHINESLTISRAKSLPGRFSINEIVIDGRCVGRIQFIVGTP